MFSVNALSIGAAHREAVRKIVKLGVPGVTEDGEHVVYLEEPLCIHVSDPLNDYYKDANSPYGLQFDEYYIHKTCQITPRRNDGTDAVYTYGNRIRDYLQPQCVRDMGSLSLLVGDGNMSNHGPVGYDQLERCWEKIEENPATRRAVMSTWIPWKDHVSHDPPCIMTISLEVVRKEYLSLVAFIRSNDILMGWGQNAIGLTAMLELSCIHLGYKVGYLETISRNAHIYYKRDENYLNDMGFVYDGG